jgi:hydrogenase maturation protease
MTNNSGSVLILCYGNPGRLDDGLGAAFAEKIRNLVPLGVTVEVDYLLTVEHASDIAENSVVIFVDAALTGPEPFSFRRVEPLMIQSFSTHVIEPGSVLGLAAELFEAEIPGYCLAIRGYEFDAFGERLSSKAEKNLTAALEFSLQLLETREFELATTIETSGV